MGGTIKKHSKNDNTIRLLVVSEGATAQYLDKKMVKVRRNSCLKSSKILGISDVEFLDFPDMMLENIPHFNINKGIEKTIKKFKPEIVYTTSNNDLNLDHQRVFESTLVATRPFSSSVRKILCYEIPGPFRVPFNPNVYEDISKELSFKIKAFKTYHSEVMKFPHPRSVESINSYAIMRGVESNLKRAESFQLIRSIES